MNAACNSNPIGTQNLRLGHKNRDALEKYKGHFPCSKPADLSEVNIKIGHKLVRTLIGARATRLVLTPMPFKCPHP